MSNGSLAHGHTCNDRGGKQAGSSRSACLSIPSDPRLVYRPGLGHCELCNRRLTSNPTSTYLQSHSVSIPRDDNQKCPLTMVLTCPQKGITTALKLCSIYKGPHSADPCWEKGRDKEEWTQLEQPRLEELALALPWRISGKLSVKAHQLGFPETRAFLGCTVHAVPC